MQLLSELVVIWVFGVSWERFIQRTQSTAAHVTMILLSTLPVSLLRVFFIDGIAVYGYIGIDRSTVSESRGVFGDVSVSQRNLGLRSLRHFDFGHVLFELSFLEYSGGLTDYVSQLSLLQRSGLMQRCVQTLPVPLYRNASFFFSKWPTGKH